MMVESFLRLSSMQKQAVSMAHLTLLKSKILQICSLCLLSGRFCAGKLIQKFCNGLFQWVSQSMTMWLFYCASVAHRNILIVCINLGILNSTACICISFQFKANTFIGWPQWTPPTFEHTDIKLKKYNTQYTMDNILLYHFRGNL